MSHRRTHRQRRRGGPDGEEDTGLRKKRFLENEAEEKEDSSDYEDSKDLDSDYKEEDEDKEGQW